MRGLVLDGGESGSMAAVRRSLATSISTSVAGPRSEVMTFSSIHSRGTTTSSWSRELPPVVSSCSLESPLLTFLLAVQSRELVPSLKWVTKEVMVLLMGTSNSGLGGLGVSLSGSASTGRAGERGWLVVCQSSTSPEESRLSM